MTTTGIVILGETRSYVLGVVTEIQVSSGKEAVNLEKPPHLADIDPESLHLGCHLVRRWFLDN